MSRSSRPGRTAQLMRCVVALGYLALFVWQYRRSGFPFDRETVLLWIAGAVAVAGIGRGRRQTWRFVRDWIPFAALLLIYDLAYGLVEYLGQPVRVRWLVAFDKFLFGGEVAAVWLQRHITHTGEVAWWELGVAIVYASHFVVPFATAGVLWWRSRERWRQWASELLTVSFVAVLIYAAVPTGAPWYAAKLGLIPELDRPVGRGWLKIGLRAAPDLLERGRLFVNPYAAMPSLHAAYSFLFALFVYRLIGRGRWRMVLFAYPAAMAFSLMFGGEHFAADILAGWVLALLAAPICRRVERFVRRLRARSSQRADHACHAAASAEAESAVAIGTDAVEVGR